MSLTGRTLAALQPATRDGEISAEFLDARARRIAAINDRNQLGASPTDRAAVVRTINSLRGSFVEVTK